MQLRTIGVDLSKAIFHLGLIQRVEVVVRKKLARKQLLHFTANLQVELIGMEACGGSHSLRQFDSTGLRADFLAAIARGYRTRLPLYLGNPAHVGISPRRLY